MTPEDAASLIAIFAIVAGCGGPAATRTVVASPSPGCPEVERAIADAMASVPDGAIRVADSYDSLMARTTELARTGRALVSLRDRVTAPTLATKTNDFAQATHWLTYLTASLAGAKQSGIKDLVDYEHALYLAGRERELARRAAVAECVDDGAREQEAAWKAEATAAVSAIAPRVASCLDAARARPPTWDAVDLKFHVGATGAVTVAGPDASAMLPVGGATTEAVYCLVRELERTKFPPPNGNAILIIPVERTDGP